MRQIKIKNTIIGDEKVKICVPISARDFSELEAELQYAFESLCDIIELRYDYLAEITCRLCEINKQRHLGNVLNEVNNKQKQFESKKHVNFLNEMSNGNLNNVKRGKLILFTFRTKREGGFGTDDDENYYNINEQAILSGQVDIIDVEFTKDKPLINRLIKLAHENNVKVIISKHYFETSLSKEKQLEMLKKMQETGADIVKLATTVYDEVGAQEVISAAEEMYNKHATVPIITIGMGEFGKITRQIEPFYGSAITYAKGLKATAPGQMSVSELLGEV